MERRVKKMSKAQKEMLLNKMRALPEQRVKVKKIY
jgi:predicted GIY-YIG superfamily endonuclease